MKTTAIVAAAALGIVIVAAGVYMIDIDQTEEARLPTVDVSVEGGNLPEFKAEVGSISVTEEQVEVTVPEVDVTMEEKTITVPGLEVNPPKEDG